jgi:hypothetical protein
MAAEEIPASITAAAMVDEAEVVQKLAALLRDIVGSSVAADQPFMEVRLDGHVRCIQNSV